MRKHVLRNVVILALIWTSAAPPVQSQDLGSVVGRLVSAETRAPIAGATVELESDTARRVRLVLMTDDRGRFVHLGVRTGRYRARVKAEGFAGVDVVEIEVLGGERIRLNLQLTPIVDAPFEREEIRYRRPLVNTEDAAITTRL